MAAGSPFLKKGKIDNAPLQILDIQGFFSRRKIYPFRTFPRWCHGWLSAETGGKLEQN